MKHELRKAHFNFGNDQLHYETTNKQTFNPLPVRSATDMHILKQAQTERKLKMRQQNFIYGQDVPTYQSMAKKDFPLHNNTDALQNM